MKSFVVFLGVDGSGKSTLISTLCEKLDNCTIFHFSPTTKYNKSKSRVIEPHSKKKYSKLVSIIKLVYLIINAIYGYIFFIKRKVKKNHILGDRYFYDIFFDQKRYRLNLPLFLNKLIFKIFPRPDIVFVCIGDPKIISSRKKEISLVEIKKQQSNLRNVSHHQKNWILLDTTKYSVPELITIIMKYIN